MRLEACCLLLTFSMALAACTGSRISSPVDSSSGEPATASTQAQTVGGEPVSGSEAPAARAGQEQPAPAAQAPAGAGTQGAAAVAGSERTWVDVAGLKTDLEAHRVPLLVDVRSPQEFSGGHVPGAVNIPLDQLPSRLSELQPYKDQSIYVICEVGGRSARGAALLTGEGYHPVDVHGGTRAWKAEGFPTE